MNRTLLLSLLASFASMMPALADDPIRWTDLSDLDRASRSYVQLDEEESVKDIQVARVRLKEKTPSGDVDALFVHHNNSLYCGSAGCLFEVLVKQKDGTMKKVLDINASELTLGSRFTKGMRNLRFDDAVTWVWNGRTYDLK